MVADSDYFWVPSNVTYTTYSSSNRIDVHFKYKYTDVENKKRQIENVLNEIKSGISNNTSDYSKLLYVHDWLVSNIDYVKSEDHGDQDIYYALVLKKCVCAGFARAFKYILNNIGIGCEYIAGRSLRSVHHAWNIVTIGNKSAYFDVTWDNQDDRKDEYSYISHAMFGISYEEMCRTHTTDPEYLDRIVTNTTEEWNYLKNNGCEFNIYNRDRIIQALRINRHHKDDKVEFKFTSKEVYDNAYKMLKDPNEMREILNVIGITQAGYIIMRDGSFYTIVLMIKE